MDVRNCLRIKEFQGKIEAAVAKRDPDFLMIAGTEALIAGLDEAEALRRAQAYVEASADIILIHSKKRILARSQALRVPERNRCRWSSCRLPTWILTLSGSRRCARPHDDLW
ncbi:isocitrate lyase/phosphoenolpyruvate mutase family protein [Bradyrhizobium ivorense]|uniref:isocitrate lyase/phosphoenolpyruvate mutase family protein n=1 Tax=Bradyrhizobium ivorense TaxID=2511166 RepID=UPI001FCE5FA9|nr:isocitrate lyase/phosphoenolpyruvate mutase family protein [Bradyrhizobium ivorense]